MKQYPSIFPASHAMYVGNNLTREMNVRWRMTNCNALAIKNAIRFHQHPFPVWMWLISKLIVVKIVYSDSGTDNLSTERKRRRTQFNSYQKLMLQQSFMTNDIPNKGQLADFARIIGLPVTVCQVWFQNNRSRARKCSNNRSDNRQIWLETVENFERPDLNMDKENVPYFVNSNRKY